MKLLLSPILWKQAARRSLVGLVVGWAGAFGYAVAADAPPLKIGALLVQNRVGEEYNSATAAIKGRLNAMVVPEDIMWVSSEVSSEALRKGGPGEAEDVALANAASPAAHARQLGADFLLLVKAVSMDVESDSVPRSEGGKAVFTKCLMQVSYEIKDLGNVAGSMGGNVESRDVVRTAIPSSLAVNKMARECADKLVAEIPAKLKALKITKAVRLPVSIECIPSGPEGQSLTVPEFVVADDGSIKRGSGEVEMRLAGAVLTVNGAVIGSAPGVFKLPKGLNRIRVNRDGYEAWGEVQLLVEEDQPSLKIALRLDEASYSRWKDRVGFLYSIEKDRKLTDAEVEMIKGLGEYFRNSKHSIDYKGKSPFDGANVQQQNNMRN